MGCQVQQEVHLKPSTLANVDNDGERESIAEQQNEASFLENVANYAMLADDALAFTFTFKRVWERNSSLGGYTLIKSISLRRTIFTLALLHKIDRKILSDYPFLQER